MTDKKTKYERIATFFTEDNELIFPPWLENLYNALLNLTFTVIWLLFFGYLFKQIDNASVGVFRNADTYGRNIYIYMAVHYTLLFFYLWVGRHFYRCYFFCPRNLWNKTVVLLVSFALFVPAFELTYVDTYFVEKYPQWEITSSAWFTYYLEHIR